ncbi:MAG: helix-hairpin-helix domain-containing protein [Clostridium sp.]|jgi:uncharacterized protein|nr:helix-hairpin-helix domain-containing protein [Clostridium sp.]
MDIAGQITAILGVGRWQVDAAVKLIDEGNTIPFISRYRKEVTGSLDDEQLRELDERLKYLRTLEEKKAQVEESIREQGKLTDELQQKIMEAQTLVVVEDLYRPYRPKRKTRASVAKEKGLQGLADVIMEQKITSALEEEATGYLSEEKGVLSVEDAINGAKDILAESISDEASYRLYIREATQEEGVLQSVAKDEKASSVYEMYYQYEEPIRKAALHRILAINRGEAEKVLTVKIIAPTERILRYLEKMVITADNPITKPVLEAVVQDSYERLIAPAIEREIRNDLTEKADEQAIGVFGKNLKQLLMAPPIAGKVVLGWDPAFRTGCKLAVVDATGKVLDTKVIYPTAPQNKVAEAKLELKRLIKKYHVDLISLGNGTASRESEQIIVDFIKEFDQPLSYVIVNEAGASVYSASKLATEEFPNFDVGQRSAASIARRLLDPLAELVKIDPKSIGVGQYQHDMNQKRLDEALTGVVEDCVNKVGVDLNTASMSLLGYISGISKPIAKNIVEYRETKGRFGSRHELLKVPKLGPKAYEQCAGFLRILDGKNPLDATSVHPESYEAAQKLLDKLGMTMADVRKAQKNLKTTQQISTSQGDESKISMQSVLTQKTTGTTMNVAKQSNKTQMTPTSTNTSLNAAGQSAQPQLTLSATNTAMGRALAAAMMGGGKNARSVLESAANHGAKSGAKTGANPVSSTEAKSGAKPETQTGKSSTARAQDRGLSSRVSNKSALAQELGIGEITLTDILKELEKPARDPREDMPKPILRQDILEMKDLKPGMVLKGTVRNVIDFGVFVDIGVHQDGLVHISRITDRFIKHPLEAVSVGDVVDVEVLEVDPQKKRIGLTMKIGQKETKRKGVTS